jgi:hypothetical protein
MTTGIPLPRQLVERRVPWTRDRFWRPGEPMTLEEDGGTVTYLLRGVMRDTDPDSPFATVTLERVRSVAEEGAGSEPLSAAG